jgi:hypothetical protein
MAKTSQNKTYNFPSAEVQLFVKESLQEVMKEFTEITRAAAKDLAQLTVNTAADLAKITLSTAVDLAKMTKESNEHFTSQIFALQSVNTEKSGAKKAYMIIISLSSGMAGALITHLLKF